MKILCSCLQGHNGKGQKLVLIYLPLLLLFSCYVVLDSLHPMDCSPPGFPVFESVMPSNHLILCCPLLFLPSIIPSIRVFSNESALCITWPKYWNISFSISPFNEYSGLISFGIDWFDRSPCCPRDSKSLLQHCSLKASVLWHSAFFMVHLSHICMITGRTVG